MNQVYLKKELNYVYVQSYICNNTSPSLIVLPNLGWYHVGPNRIFTQLAEFSNKENINVFCFDYIGTGESSGFYDDITWDILLESSLDVFEYVRQTCQGRLFVLGYGIGNLLMNKIRKLLPFDGFIYYLPEFEAVDSFEKKFSLQEISEMQKKGYLNIEVQNNKKHLYFRTIVGGFHDCTYNPIPYNIVEELRKDSNISALDYTGNQLFIVDTLEISEKEQSEKKQSEKKQTEYFYVPEFKENIVPTDWYKKSNQWPDTLYKVNTKIVSWINAIKKPEEVVTGGMDKRNINITNRMRNDCIIREAVSVPSDDNVLSGILHYPSEVNKKLPCAIFLPGLGGDKVDNFMCGPRLGDLLSRNEIVLFRYDNRFSGTSKNSLTGYTWTEVIEDFHNVYQYLIKYSNIIDFDKIIFISWSAGAKVANHIISNTSYGIKAGCYWNPVFLEGTTGMKVVKKNSNTNNTRFTKNSRGEFVTQIGGENLGIGYNRDNKKYNFKEEFDNITIPLSFIWGSRDIDTEEFQYIESLKQNAMIQVFTVDSDHHLFSYDQLEYIHKITLKWIKTIVYSL